MTQEFANGYKACLTHINKSLSDIVKRNGGCKTPYQAWNVTSDMIYLMHTEHAAIQQEEIELAGGM